MNEPVTSVATDTTLDVNVTSAYGGSGAAVNHSTASISATIKNLSQADDIWYQIDSGAFVQLPERQSVPITINFASQTLKLKRGEFTSSSVPVQVVALGVPSGTYARGQELGSAPADGSITLAKMADLAPARLIGRVTAGTGVPEALTAAQVKTLLAISAADLAALGVPVPAETALSAAQLATASSAPPIIVPAPGAGKKNVFLGVVITKTPGSTQLATTNFNVFYQNGDDPLVALITIIQGSADVIFLGAPVVDIVSFTAAQVENKPLVLSAESDDATPGMDTTFAVSVLYRVVNA